MASPLFNHFPFPYKSALITKILDCRWLRSFAVRKIVFLASFILAMTCSWLTAVLDQVLEAKRNATFTVALRGNDSNPGTFEKAFPTIERARDQFTASGEIGLPFDLHNQYNPVQRSLLDHLGQSGGMICGYGPGVKDVSHHDEVINNHIHLTFNLLAPDLCDAFPTPAEKERQSEMETPSAPGKLIDIGGFRLHFTSIGKDDPAVVVIAGSGDFSFDWSLVQPQVAKFARACAYDRAGEAWSDPGPIPRTMRQEAYELHLLLEKAGIKGPYILVGHSLGGLVARTYAARYPREVVGMVLVDAADPDTTLDLNGKLVRMRELAKGRPVPSEQTMLTSPPQPPSAADIQRFQEYQKRSRQPKIAPLYDKLPAHIQALDLWARSRPPRAAWGRISGPKSCSRCMKTPDNTPTTCEISRWWFWARQRRPRPRRIGPRRNGSAWGRRSAGRG